MDKVVIGLGFGDEGKGSVVNWLAKKGNPIVVRYCGGHQVGHTVVEKNQHTFSNFGAGTLFNVHTEWNADTCDPVGFKKEYLVLEEKEIIPSIYINPNTPVTTIYDKMYNLKVEETNNHSTMGVGFGATIKREEDNYHLLFKDLFFKNVLKEKVKMIKDYYNRKGVTIREEDKIEFFESCDFMIKHINFGYVNKLDKIYESSQGLMLDKDYGFFPFVTNSQVGTQKLDVKEDTEFYLVTRAYQTRHGNGYCSDEKMTPNIGIHAETNVMNDNQGEFKTRVLDLDLLNYAMLSDDKIKYHKRSKKHVVITCLDHLQEYKLTFGNELKSFKTESDFLDFISFNLVNINKIYVSHGPESHNIQLYRSNLTFQ